MNTNKTHVHENSNFKLIFHSFNQLVSIYNVSGTVLGEKDQILALWSLSSSATISFMSTCPGLEACFGTPL